MVMVDRAARRAALAVALLLALAAPAEALKAPRFGLGIILGEPTGLTGKLFMHPNHAVDMILAYDITDEAFAMAVDYHFVFDPWPFRIPAGEMPIYVGIGGKLSVFGEHSEGRHDDHHDEDVAFGLRIPIGLAFLFNRVPIEIFLEIAPGIRLFPATDADVDGGIGVRFYF